MRTQQQAERAEQQRIKNLVLNYDLSSAEDASNDGTKHDDLLCPNLNHTRFPISPRGPPAPDLPEKEVTLSSNRNITHPGAEGKSRRTSHAQQLRENMRPKSGRRA